MNLVGYSIRTKGVGNFARRLWTVFARFGITERQTRDDLHTIVNTVKDYGGAPTFFIPAVVLGRHGSLIDEIHRSGAEIGIHGYVHNDFRSLTEASQRQQTKMAMDVFRRIPIPFHGFRNPYLGWNDDSVSMFTQLGFMYDSNEAVLHDVLDLSRYSEALRDGFEKSLSLFQAIECSAYTLRPHFEGTLLRIPTSIPDDEMLYDRMRMTDQKELGGLWSAVMRRIYGLGGIFVLNLHPERGKLCQPALAMLLKSASSQPLPVWITHLRQVAEWWQERSRFTLTLTPLGPSRWRVDAQCSPRATILGRQVIVEDAQTSAWHGTDVVIEATQCIVSSALRPCIGLSPDTSDDVANFLQEQGYPAVRAPHAEAAEFACYLTMPNGLGEHREEQRKRRSALIDQIESLDAPLIRFACWPSRQRAALSITGDIDSITVQDFFLRILETRKYA